MDFHKYWRALSNSEIHDALLIIPDLELEWILDPLEYQNEHNLPALLDHNFAALLQWKHNAGHVHCALNNGLFWWNLNKQLSINLPDPTTYHTTNYKALILNESYYGSKAFCPRYGANKEEIFSMLRGEFVHSSIARIVIKEIIFQSISTLYFVGDCCSLSAGSSPSTAPCVPTSEHSRSMTSDEDLSDDDFLESILSDGLSDGFPDTFPDDELTESVNEQSRNCRTFASLSLLSLPSTSWLTPISETHETVETAELELTPFTSSELECTETCGTEETPGITPPPDSTPPLFEDFSSTVTAGEDSEESIDPEYKPDSPTERSIDQKYNPYTPSSFADIENLIDSVLAPYDNALARTRSGEQSGQQSDISSVASSTPWPMARTASEEAEDQKRFCVMTGSMLHDSELYFDADSYFMRKADEETRPFPLSNSE